MGFKKDNPGCGCCGDACGGLGSIQCDLSSVDAHCVPVVVTVTNLSTGGTGTHTFAGLGSYTFTSLPAGSYSVAWTPADTCHCNVPDVVFVVLDLGHCNAIVSANEAYCDPAIGCWHTCPGYGSRTFCGECPAPP